MSDVLSRHNASLEILSPLYGYLRRWLAVTFRWWLAYNSFSSGKGTAPVSTNLSLNSCGVGTTHIESFLTLVSSSSLLNKVHRMKVLVTGGAGYVGFRLGCRLLELGRDVVLFDLRAPAAELPKGASFVAGDVRDKDALVSACQGVDEVYHVASYGMSGAESLQHQLIYDVNVRGTESVVYACQLAGVKRLVYTSTYNVVFEGKPIENGDESAPYVDPARCNDAYSVTKAHAERLVLAANTGYAALEQSSSSSSSSDDQNNLVGGEEHLRTCAVRPAGIWGPGEQRHVPRVIGLVQKGLLVCIFGSPDSLVDWLHVDNLIQAMICAGEGLTQAKGYVAEGQVYFISDDQPINNFEFFRPLITGLGYSFPTVRLPYLLVYYLVALMQLLHVLLKPFLVFTPILTCAEVSKCAVTHYFKMDKAKSELGYKPVAHPMEETVQWFKQHGYGASAVSSRKNTFLLPSRTHHIILLVFMLLLARAGWLWLMLA